MNKNITFAASYRRAFASIIDAILFLFLSLGVFAILEAIFAITPWYLNAKENTDSLKEASGLFIEIEGEWTSPVEAESYQEYEKLITYFYEKGAETAAINAIPDLKGQPFAYWYNVHQLGLEDFHHVYGYFVLESPSDEGSELFQWAKKEDGTRDETKIGIPSDSCFLAGSAYDEEGNLRPFSNLKEEARKDLLTFYYDESGASPSLYYRALSLLNEGEPYQSALREEEAIRRAYPLAISFAISYPILYLLLPLLFKEGATIGKYMLKIGLVNKYGYRVLKGQLVLRSLPTYFLAIILILFLPSPWIAYAILLGLLLLSYALALFTPTHQALHDFLAASYVIDLRSSTIYSSKVEEEEARKMIEEAEEKGAKMRQAGEEILEQEAKKEG